MTDGPPDAHRSVQEGTCAIDGSWRDPENRRARVRALVAAETAGDETIAEALAGLCRSLARHIGITGAVVNVMSRAGSDAILAAADDASRRVGQLHYDVGDGPGQSAFGRGRPVLVSDLGSEATRWPGYGPVALGVGVGAIFVFPLQVGASRFGLLTAYDDQIRHLSEEDIACCLSFAELATEMLIDGPGAQVDGHLDPDLVRSLEFRTEVYQAQGMVSVSMGIGLGDALATLRARAYALDQDLASLAADVVAGRVDLNRDNPPPALPSTDR